MEGGDVKFKFSADPSELIRATETTNIVIGELGKTGETAGKKLDTAMTKAAGAGTKAVAAVGPLTGVLNKVSPAAGAAASAVAGLGGSARALGAALSLSSPVMAGLTAALLAGGAAYAFVADKASDAADAVKKSQAAMEGVKSASADLTALLVKAEDEYAVASGRATAADIQRGAAIDEVIKKRDALTGVLEDGSIAEKEAINEANQAIGLINATADALDRKAEKEAAALKAKEALTRAERQNTEALRELQAVQAQQLATWDAEIAAAQEARGVVAAWEEQTRSLRDSQLEGIDAVIAKRDEDLESLRETFAAQMAAQAENDVQRLELIAAYEAAKAGILGTSLEEEQGLRDADAEMQVNRLKDIAKEHKANALAIASSAASLMGDLSATFAAAGEERSKTHKEEARTLFLVSKAAAIGQAIVNTALAVTGALTIQPPPVGIAFAALEAALGAVAIGTIAAEPVPFHSGGVVPGIAADEVPAKLLPGEGVVNRQGMRALDALNSGGAAGGTTILRIGRREAREIARTDIRANGLIPATARKVAQQGTRGVSGRRPIA